MHLLPESGQLALSSLLCPIVAIVFLLTSKCCIPATFCTQKSGQQVVYSKSRPSDRHHLHPNTVSQRSSPLHSKECLTGHLIHSISCLSDRRLLHPKITPHRPSALNVQHPHTLSHLSNYLYPTIAPWTISSIPFRLPWLSAPTYTPIASQWLPTDEEWTTIHPIHS